MTKSNIKRVGGNTTVIPVGYVDPNKPSNTQVGPGFYSLSKRSNVPFVALIGSGGFRKTISWGEIAEVPEKQLVRVQNASFHGGDIWLNKGDDYCNRPSRITVPVNYSTTTIPTIEGDIEGLAMSYPCDTRGAKRAYLNVDATVVPNSLTAFIRGRRLDGSMNTKNSLQYFAKPYGPGVGFLSAIDVPIATDLAYIPLGQAASMGDDTRPHNLLDAGDVFFVLGAPGNPLSDYFSWPADAAVFGFPTGVNPDGPGMWYIVEYD